MAETGTVWGIDIGQAGLKALQLRYNEASQQVIAVGFDYIQHPKILSQPDAIPAELINEALKTFVTRNAAQLRGAQIGFVVPSNTSIVKFIQLPPVEASKVGDIVKYEARQQIPFDLNDVIWDWQTMGGGIQEGGYMLDSEVGLVAMKKEALQNHLKPFTELRMEIDTIQAVSLAMFNFMSYDQFEQRPDDPVLERDGYTVLLDMGADTTTMLVSNGRKIWQRNISIGGNQFTRALTKEMKLTFAKSEHLKCNATKAPDPKAVFQALRPVFNDYVSEIQRSIGFFSSVNRDAKIEKILAIGNGFKLAGLQKFLQQNLQYDVERVENFPGLVGDAVLSQPLFQENAMSFAVAYGLGLQMLKQTTIRTSLLPPEIKTARMIRRKKPWAVATAACLLLGLCLSTMGFAFAKSTVEVPKWKKSEDKVAEVQGEATKLKGEYDTAEAKNKEQREQGEFLVKPATGRVLWLEVYKAINACLPQEGETSHLDITKRNRIRLYSITCKEELDLKKWYDDLKLRLPSCDDYLQPEADKAKPPEGPGWVFTLRGLHFNTGKDRFMIENLLRPLQQWQVTVNLAGNRQQVVPVRQMGISHAMLLTSLPSQKLWYPNGLPSNFAAGGIEGPGAGMGPRGFAGVAPGIGNNNRPPRPNKTPMGPGGVVDPLNERKAENIWQTDFEIVFVWKETPAAVRLAAEPPPPTAEGAIDPAAPGATPAPGAPPVPGAVPTGAVPGTAPMTAPGIAPPGGAPAGAPGVAPAIVPPGTPPAAGN
ncbi:MAG: type IV pilus assembly protein PilM [Planctomycetota bacterium]